MLRIVMSVFTAMLLSVTATGVQASWEEARDSVDKASAQMMQVLEKEQFRQEDQINELMAELETILAPVVDFEYISKRVMGKHYRKASQQEKSYFIDVFKDTLIKTYAASMSGFDIVRYEIAAQGKASPKPNKQVVSVYVYAQNGTRYTLVYYMLKQPDGWKLVNILVDGINLRLNFKNQFSSMVSEAGGNVGQVIADWESLVSTDSEGA
ncbi:MAG: ABC transporter substrate-binding protein [Amphritea sp.]